MAELLPGVGTVQVRRFVQVLRNALQRGQVIHGVHAHPPPAAEDDQREHGRPRNRSGQPFDGFHPQPRQQGIHQRPGQFTENQAEGDAGDDDADQRWKEQRRTEETPCGHLFGIQHHREDHRHRDQDRAGADHIDRTVLQRCDEGRVPHFPVVVQADKTCLPRDDALEAHDDRGYDRVKEESQKDDHKGSDEHIRCHLPGVQQ